MLLSAYWYNTNGTVCVICYIHLVLKSFFSNKDKILLKENGMLSQQTQYPLLPLFWRYYLQSLPKRGLKTKAFLRISRK